MIDNKQKWNLDQISAVFQRLCNPRQIELLQAMDCDELVTAGQIAQKTAETWSDETPAALTCARIWCPCNCKGEN